MTVLDLISDTSIPSNSCALEPLNILMLCDNRHASNVVNDHINAFGQYSHHNIFHYNPIEARRVWRINFKHYDAIIIHYSLYVLGEYFLPNVIADAIKEYNGLKIQFIQDEYRNINRMIDKMVELKINIIFSSLNTDNIKRVYADKRITNVVKCSTLPGYVPANLKNRLIPKMCERKTHVTYRARELPYWLGDHSRLKNDIAEKFPFSIGDKYKLNYDISAKEVDRIYGDDWIEFLLSGKAVLATEGGASIFDFDGAAEKEVTRFLNDSPEASYDEVVNAVLYKYEGNIVHKALTPRIFESIALKVALVMFPGDYAGILKPWEHYIPLQKDFSNAKEVAGLLKDDDYLQRLVDRAYKDIIESDNYNMESFIRKVDYVISMRFESHKSNMGKNIKSKLFQLLYAKCKYLFLYLNTIIENRINLIINLIMDTRISRSISKRINFKGNTCE